MFPVSGGSCNKAKHILLLWAVKTLTGNVEKIKHLIWLNLTWRFIIETGRNRDSIVLEED